MDRLRNASTGCRTHDIAIDGALVVTPAGSHQASLYVTGDRISAISVEPMLATKRIVATGMVLLPGFVDAHVHLMEPASSAREDWWHGTTAAAAAGVTTLIEHTHDGPVRNRQELEIKADFLSDKAVVDFALAAHAWTDGALGAIECWEAGAAYVKVFTCSTHGVPGIYGEPLLELLSAAAEVRAVSLVHCEDAARLQRNAKELRAHGRSDGGVIPAWRDRRAELLAVHEVLEAARDTGATVIIAHASHRDVINAVTAAKANGVQAYVETCPQYLELDEREVIAHGALRKFTPPARIRNPGDSADMWEAVRTGLVHHIASDHAPSTLEQKLAADIWDAPFGLPGIDTTGPLLIDAVLRGKLVWEELATLYADHPARMFGLSGKGRLAEGMDADLVLIDPNSTQTLTHAAIRSKAAWTPYHGREIRGRVAGVFLRGRKIVSDGSLAASATAGTGRLIRPRAKASNESR